MAGNNYFHFKKFRIIQEKSAMRVGTDGVLLGAWADISGARKILDVGTGTGLIALMLAQRTTAKITGIEIERNAADEATTNAQNSPWPDRVEIIHSSLQEFMKNSADKFDVIVSNPPFYFDGIRSKSDNSQIARHGVKLKLHDLAKAADHLLFEKGKLSLILPVDSAKKFINLAESYGLNLSALTEVKPSGEKPPHRFLMEFSRSKFALKKTVISIQNEFGSYYTADYKSLTRDFYLNF